MDKDLMRDGYLQSQQHDRLLTMLDGLPDDSSGVLRLRCEIRHHPSFFPGGRGYRGPGFPVAPVMFLGHNFDTDTGFRLSVERGHEDAKMPTWRNLLAYFLPEAKELSGVSVEDCFFTNVYLGAMIHPKAEPGKKQKTTNTGTFKCSPDYGAACIGAIRTQIEIVRPAVIALLGRNAAKLFEKGFPRVFQRQPDQPKGGQLLKLLPDLAAQVIELVHPSNPRSIESHREQGRKLGEAIAAYRGRQSRWP